MAALADLILAHLALAMEDNLALVAALIVLLPTVADFFLPLLILAQRALASVESFARRAGDIPDFDLMEDAEPFPPNIAERLPCNLATCSLIWMARFSCSTDRVDGFVVIGAYSKHQSNGVNKIERGR